MWLPSKMWLVRRSRARPPGGLSDREARWQSDLRCRYQSKVLAVEIGICYNQTTWWACLTQLNQLGKNPSRPSGFLISNFVEGNALGVIFPLPRLRRISDHVSPDRRSNSCVLNPEFEGFGLKHQSWNENCARSELHVTHRSDRV